MAENDLDKIGRPPSAPGRQQANAEEMLAELVRLIKSPGFALTRQPPPVEIAPEQDLPASEPTQAPERGSLESALNALFDEPQDTAVVAVEPPEPRKSGVSSSNNSNGIALAATRRSGAWTLGVSALVLAGVALIAATYGLEQIMFKPPPLTAAAENPTPVQPDRDPSIAASNDPQAIAPRDITQPAEGKTVSPEQRPIDPNARAALENPPPSQDPGPTASGVAQPEALPAEKPPAAAVDTPAAAAPGATPPSAASQSPEKAAPAVSLPSEPAQVATPAPATAEMGVAPPSDAPLPPVRPAPKATVQASGPAQRPTAKLEAPTKLSGPSGAHPAAKLGATSLAAPQSPLRLGASANPENKAAQASVDPAAQPAPAPKQPNANPVARAVGAVAGAVGAVAGLIPFVPH